MNTNFTIYQINRDKATWHKVLNQIADRGFSEDWEFIIVYEDIVYDAITFQYTTWESDLRLVFANGLNPPDEFVWYRKKSDHLM